MSLDRMSDDALVSGRARVVNRAGLHARPCHAIVSTALRFGASLRVRVGASGSTVDGKSILDLMTLEASEGLELEFLASGADAEEMVAALVALVSAGFHEPRS